MKVKNSSTSNFSSSEERKEDEWDGESSVTMGAGKQEVPSDAVREFLTYYDACEEAERRAEAGEAREPILIATLEAGACEELFGEQKGVWLEDVGDGLLRAWLYEMASPEHDGSGNAGTKWLTTYELENEYTLFDELPEGHLYYMKPWSFLRPFGVYYDVYGTNSTVNQREVNPTLDAWARQFGLRLVRIADHSILPDAMLCIMRMRQAAEGSDLSDSVVVATPFIIEVEYSHRNLYQALAHAAQMLQTWTSTTNVLVVLVEPTVAVLGEKFYAAYFWLSRVFDEHGKPTRHSQVKAACEFGTRPFEPDATTKLCALRLCQKFGVRNFLGISGPALLTATDFPITPLLNDSERGALQGLLARPVSKKATPALCQKMTLEFGPGVLYGESALRARSTPLRINLYDILLHAVLCRFPLPPGQTKKRARSAAFPEEAPPARPSAPRTPVSVTPSPLPHAPVTDGICTDLRRCCIH